jgi:hypothetical protein
MLMSELQMLMAAVVDHKYIGLDGAAEVARIGDGDDRARLSTAR